MKLRQLEDKLREQALRCIYPNFTTLAEHDRQAMFRERMKDDRRGRAYSHPMDWFYDEMTSEDVNPNEGSK